MEKNTNINQSKAGSNKDAFKNTPHLNGSIESTSGLGSTAGSNFEASDAVSSSSTESSGMMQNLDEMKNKIVDQTRPAMDRLRSGWQGIQDTGRPYIESAGSYVRRYPMSTVLGAVAVGALVGMLIARPSQKV